MILLPIERVERATVHFNSGLDLKITAATLYHEVSPHNDLIRLSAIDHRGTFPLYQRLGDISAIEHHRVWRWRWPSWWEALIWVALAAAAVWLRT